MYTKCQQLTEETEILEVEGPCQQRGRTSGWNVMVRCRLHGRHLWWSSVYLIHHPSTNSTKIRHCQKLH